MKISNLYIGDIGVVTRIKNVPLKGSFKQFNGVIIFEATITHKIKRHTIFLKPNNKSNQVKDIIYGGKYKIKNPTDCKVGEEFVSNLDQLKLVSAIQETGYTKNGIAKRKLLKIVNESELLK